MIRFVLASLIGCCLLFALVSCGGSRPVGEGFVQAVESSGDTLDFSQHFGFEWDVCYAFGPYTSNEQIAKVVGLSRSPDYSIDMSDDHHLLLFVQSGKIVRALEVPRKVAFDLGTKEYIKVLSSSPVVGITSDANGRKTISNP